MLFFTDPENWTFVSCALNVKTGQRDIQSFTCVVHVRWLLSYIFFKYFLALCFFVNFVHCAKTAEVYSRRPPGVLVLVFPLCLLDGTSCDKSVFENALRCISEADGSCSGFVKVNKPSALFFFFLFGFWNCRQSQTNKHDPSF